MDAKQIKEAIGRCRAPEALREIVEACRAQEGELRKCAREQMAHATEQAWLSVRGSKPDHVAVVFNGAEIYMGVAGNQRTDCFGVSILDWRAVQVFQFVHDALLVTRRASPNGHARPCGVWLGGHAHNAGRLV